MAKNQTYLKAYFKGGTAVYKILDTMNRFSEDIDLTVEIIKGDSNNSNRTRLKKSALGYKIEGLELERDKTKDRKQSVTAFYQYKTYFDIQQNPLHKAGEIQVEATSFTISEPTEIHTIEPIIYKYATISEQKILTKEFGIEPFEIKLQKLERIFIDKLFAAEFYFKDQKYIDLVKHLYDLTVLYKTERIQKFFYDKEEVKKIVKYKREEELYRTSGIDQTIKMKDFNYFGLNYNEEIMESYRLMQEKYIFKNEYKFDFYIVQKTLKNIKEILNDYGL